MRNNLETGGGGITETGGRVLRTGLVGGILYLATEPYGPLVQFTSTAIGSVLAWGKK